MEISANQSDGNFRARCGPAFGWKKAAELMKRGVLVASG
jgi:hypothetical protein